MKVVITVARYSVRVSLTSLVPTRPSLQVRRDALKAPALLVHRQLREFIGLGNVPSNAADIQTFSRTQGRDVTAMLSYLTRLSCPAEGVHSKEVLPGARSQGHPTGQASTRPKNRNLDISCPGC